ncbi:MAG: tRNA lysidine(34) synthetase TilS, partial [Dehalococcoidia bacterium]
EIRRLGTICRPDVGVISNIGPAHLEGVGSIEGVAEAKAELLEKEVPIAIPGETTLPGWVVKAHISERASCNENAFSAYFDLDKAGTALSIRPRKRGDRFQPLGMAETKKLQDFMVDARIPQSWRNTIPVLTSPAHILWVVGWRIDERAKVTDSTQNVLHITFEKSG